MKRLARILSNIYVILLCLPMHAQSWSDRVKALSYDNVEFVSVAHHELDDQLVNCLGACHFAAFQKAYEEYWSPEQEELIREKVHKHLDAFRSCDAYALFVMVHRATVIGWMLCKQEQYGVYLHLLCIHPDEWRKGLGRKCIQAIEAYMPNAARITLVTRKTNTAAIAFYEHLGFKKTDFMQQGYSSHDYQGFEKRSSCS